MINIKALWFYAALAASACGGAGIMGAVSPSQTDIAQALRQAQQASIQNCEMTASERAWFGAKIQNSPGKEF